MGIPGAARITQEAGDRACTRRARGALKDAPVAAALVARPDDQRLWKEALREVFIKRRCSPRPLLRPRRLLRRLQRPIALVHGPRQLGRCCAVREPNLVVVRLQELGIRVKVHCTVVFPIDIHHHSRLR